MTPTTYIPIIVLFLVIFLFLRNRNAAIARKVIKKRYQGDNKEMIELAKRFIGKDCLIYSFDGNRQFQGVIKEVTDGAILVENGGTTEAINLDFVIRIREYPKDKKGKRKSVVLD